MKSKRPHRSTDDQRSGPDCVMRGVAEVRPRGVVIGYDGMLLTLPAGSKGIVISAVR